MSQILPSFPRDNLFTERSGLPAILRRQLAPDAYAFLEPRLQSLGQEAARRGIDLGNTVDRHSPEHVPFDPLGNRIDHIVHHPAYRELERMSYGAGLISLKYDVEVRRRFPRSSHQMGFALAMVFGGAEAGLLCPLCMTDGMARVLLRHGSRELCARALPKLTTSNVNELWRGAMFLTEKQGGSDVGANTCRAVQDGGRWRLYGDKWFCSNVDAEAALVLARPDGAPEGTAGLGLYFVETNRPDGRKNGMVIHRIKDKLGVRSMATGEVTFDGASAEAVGPAGHGFKMMAEMINLSRLYNATVAVAVLTRALEEITHFAMHREAFGRPLVGHRMHLEAMADLWAQQLGAMHLVMACAQQLDLSDDADPDALRRVRLLTPMAKRHTARLSVDGVSMALELMGGQAYIEDTGMPRLLRDAQVLPIWEGTSHMQLWDIHRAAHRQEAVEPVRAWLHTGLDDRSVSARLDEQLGTLSKVGVDEFGAVARKMVDGLTNTVLRALLLRAGNDRASLAARRLAEMAWSAEGKISSWTDAELNTLCGL